MMNKRNKIGNQKDHCIELDVFIVEDVLLIKNIKFKKEKI